MTSAHSNHPPARKTLHHGIYPPALCLAVLLLFLTGCSQDTQEQIDHHLSSARNYQAEGKLSASIVELKNALQLDPDNPDTRSLLGRSYLQTGDWLGARKELGRARELGDTSDETRALLTRSLVRTGEFKTALEVADENPDLKQAVGQDLMVARGEALIGTRDYENASRAFEQVLEETAHSSALAGLARLAMMRADYAETKRYLDAGLKAAPGDVELLLLGAESQLQQKHYPEAEQLFTRVIEMDSTSLEARTGLIRSMIVQNHPEAALQQLVKLPAADQGRIDVTLLKAHALLQLEQHTEAHEQAQIVLAANPNNPVALYIAGISAYYLGQNETAYNHLKKYLARYPYNVMARKIFAAVQLREGEGVEAYKTLSELKEFGEDSTYLLLLSTTAILAGDPESSVTYLERYLATHPDDVAAKTRLGALKIALGQDEEGLAALEEAFKQAPDRAESELQLGVAYLRTGKLDQALDVAHRLQSREPGSHQGHKLEAFIQIKRKDLAKAREALTKSVELAPDDFETAYNLAQLERIAGRYDEAAAILKAFLEQQPRHLIMMTRMAEIEIKRNQPEQAEQWLSRAVEAYPREAEPRIGLARQYMSTERPTEALAVAEAGLADHPRNPRLLEIIARAQLAVGRTSDAVDTLETLTEVRPKLLEAHLYAAQALVATRQNERAIRHLEQVLALEPEHNKARLALARLLIETKQVARASKEINLLKTSMPDDAEVLDQEARLVYLRGDRKASVEVYRRAFDLSPGTNRLIALSQAEWQSGQVAKAHSTLSEWVDEHPQDIAVRKELAELYLALHDLDAAEPLFQRLAQELPDDAGILNGYAWIVWKKGKTDQGLEVAKRALALNPDEPEIQETLGAILVDKGEYRRALPLLERSASALPGNATVKYHLAQALLGLDNRIDGLRVLREALSSEAPFQERAAAERLLNSLVINP